MCYARATVFRAVFRGRGLGTGRASVVGMNASNIMIRRASELDVHSRIIVGGAICTVVRVHDHLHAGRASVTIVLDNECAIVDAAGTLYTCLAA